MLEIRLAGVRHAGWLQVDTQRAGSVLTGPWIWWGTESAGLCSCTGPNSSTQITVGRHCGIHTLLRTGHWWSSSSAGSTYSIARPDLGPVC